MPDTTALSVLAMLLFPSPMLLALTTGAGWTTMTVYDVLQEDCRATYTDKDVGNPAGMPPGG